MSGQTFTCRVCGAIGAHDTFVGREMMFGTREPYDYFQCGSCGCLQIAEIPVDLPRYYPSNYYSFSTDEPVRKPGRLRHLIEKRRTYTALFGKGYLVNRLLKPFVALPSEIHEKTGEVVHRARLSTFNDAILDAGCGSTALWLRRMALLGFTNLTGADPFIESPVSHGVVRVLKKDLTDISGKFFLIRMSHSLEHIPEQAATLSEVRRLLLPGGMALIRIPVVPSILWERYRIHWVGWDPPRHLYLHTARSLEQLAAASGLKLTATIYDSWAFNWWASEQYARDIPLISPNSHWVNPSAGLFTENELRDFSRMAEEANRTRSADQASFYFTTE